MICCIVFIYCNTRKFVATKERPIADSGNRCGNRYARKINAIFKRRIADGGNTIPSAVLFEYCRNNKIFTVSSCVPNLCAIILSDYKTNRNDNICQIPISASSTGVFCSTILCCGGRYKSGTITMIKRFNCLICGIITARASYVGIITLLCTSGVLCRVFMIIVTKGWDFLISRPIAT